MLEKRRPTPLIEVSANCTFTLPSRLVFSTRRMCWKFASFMIIDPMAAEGAGMRVSWGRRWPCARAATPHAATAARAPRT